MRDIPNYLDDPQQILLWEFDEFILLSVAFGLGIMTDYLGLMLVSGFFVVKYYRKGKDRRPNDFLLHAAYWYCGMAASEHTPTSKPIAFIRRFF